MFCGSYFTEHHFRLIKIPIIVYLESYILLWISARFNTELILNSVTVYLVNTFMLVVWNQTED